MAPNGTTATAVDLDDWSFQNWPAFVLYYTKNILFIISVIAGVLVSLFAIIITAAFIVVFSVSFIRELRNKSQPVNAAESLGEPIPLQDRHVSDESSAEQPLVAENYDLDVEKDAKQPPSTISCCYMT